jgi:hypothetical protein
MPTKHHLFFDEKEPNRYYLNYTFLHNYDEILVENYTLKIILPEGATNIKVSYFIYNLMIIVPSSLQRRLRRKIALLLDPRLLRTPSCPG